MSVRDMEMKISSQKRQLAEYQPEVIEIKCVQVRAEVVFQVSKQSKDELLGKFDSETDCG